MLNEIAWVVRCRILLVIFELNKSAYLFSPGKEEEFASGIYLGCGLCGVFLMQQKEIVCLTIY